MTVQVSCLVTFYVVPDYTAEYVALLEYIETILLTIIFTATLCWFLNSLKIYNIRHELSKEKRIVRYYFYSFFIGLGA